MPYSDLPQEEPLSIAGIGMDAIGWATYKNPFFTTRLGTSGWDPSGSKWKSKLNAIFAPGVNEKYELFDDIKKHGQARRRYSRAKAGFAATDVSASQGMGVAMNRNIDAMTGARNENRQFRKFSEEMERMHNIGPAPEAPTSPRGSGRKSKKVRMEYKAKRKAYKAQRQQYQKRKRALESVVGRARRGRTGAKGRGWSTTNVDRYDKVLEINREAKERLLGQVSKTGTASRKASLALDFDDMDDALRIALSPARGGSPINSIAAFSGERGKNLRETHIAKLARAKQGNFAWVTNLFGEGKSAGARFSAGMYGAGRLLTGVAVATMAYDVTRLALKPLAMLAEVGVAARAAPVVRTGAGLTTPGVAATIRQQAIEQMQSSAFAPRNVIGNEAQFLHV